jgi:hypothetical protein
LIATRILPNIYIPAAMPCLPVSPAFSIIGPLG